MSAQDYERRFLMQHNKGTSPQKPKTPNRSPQTTPTKGTIRRLGGSPGCGVGDRFIPIRLPADDWKVRFAAISSKGGEQSCGPSRQLFKRPHQQSGGTAPNAINSAAQGSSNTATNNAAVGNAVSSAAGSGAGGRAAAGGGSGGSTTNNGNGGNQQNGGEDSRQDVLAHRALLRNELLRARIDDVRPDYCQKTRNSPSLCESASEPSLFRFQSQRTPTKHGDPGSSSAGHTPISKMGSNTSPRQLATMTSLVSLSENSQRLLKSPRKPQRKVPKNPYKVLDAPELQDDFYLNLVDWSSQNTLSVGLGSCVYLWSACNSQVIKLCDLGNNEENDTVTSVQWTEKGDALAVGTGKGNLQVWDVARQTRTLNLTGHTSRVGCLAWNGDLVCSGSRDRLIIQRDIRAPPLVAERRLNVHRQEVCGLKWSPDHQYLASGGNDNQLLVWSLRRNEPIQTYTEHNAAVKALAWSPHHHGLLVSGGGTADRCLRFWNTLTGQPMQCVDTGSQVCNVAWSKHSNELVSTHGYSQNQIVIWKYPSLQQVVRLTGHSFRVLYLAMSPDGESIVTGAGDETLRFWHVFSKAGQSKAVRSKLNLFTSIR